MRIYRFSNILSIPFAAVLLYFLSLLLKDTHDIRAAYAVVPLAFLVLIYLFQPQIDYWWLGKYPVEIDDDILKLISRVNPKYRSMNSSDKSEFHRRLLLYINGREFLAKGMEKDTGVPYDIKCLIAQIPVSMSFTEKDFLIKEYDRIILYKHAFPSPVYKFLHTYETHHEDGVIIFSLEHMEAAFFNKEHFYNVAWHAFAEAYIQSRKLSEKLSFTDDAWNSFQEISGFDKDKISATIGFPDPDPLTVGLVHYFVYPDKFRTTWSEKYSQLSRILG